MAKNLVILTFFGLFLATGASAETVTNSEFPASFLPKISCEKTNAVVIVAEQMHTAPISRLLQEASRARTEETGAAGAYEGQADDSSKRWIGLEDPTIYVASQFLVDSNILTQFAAVHKEESVIRSIIYFESAWKKVARPLESQELEAFAVLIDNAIRDSSDPMQMHLSASTPEISKLLQIAEMVQPYIIEKVRMHPKYPFLTSGKFDKVIVGSLRSAFFAHNVLKNYCHFANKGTLRVHIGEGHAEEVKRLLETSNPDLSIKVVKAADYEAATRGWDKLVENSPQAEEIKKIIHARVPNATVLLGDVVIVVADNYKPNKMEMQKIKALIKELHVRTYQEQLAPDQYSLGLAIDPLTSEGL